MDNVKEKFYIRLIKYWLPYKGDNFKEIVRKIIFFISFITLIYSSIYIANYFLQHLKTDYTSKKLASVYNQKPTQQEISSIPSEFLEKFAGLYNINNDIKGWIRVPNTKIDHPVVQTKDNEYYLYKNFEKKYDPHGIPYADFRNIIEKDKMSTNTVLYAHNINGGKLFGDFNKYRDIEFYKQNSVINFDTIYEESLYKIFAVFVTNTDNTDPDYFDYHNYIEMNDDKVFYKFITEVNKRRLYDTGIDVKSSDKLLTFSTCANELKDGRLVVVARKLRDGEDTNLDTSLVKSNKNILYPQAWYDKFGGKKPF